jgi:hypothetical protein
MIVWDGRGCVFITFFHSRLMLCTELIWERFGSIMGGSVNTKASV